MAKPVTSLFYAAEQENGISRANRKGAEVVESAVEPARSLEPVVDDGQGYLLHAIL